MSAKKKTMRFALINRSTVTDSAHGGALNDYGVARMADVLTLYADRDVAAEWGGSYNVRASKGTDLVAGEVACALLDNLPAAPGAVAYHDVDGKAVPVIYLARTACNSLLAGPDSVMSALSHEIAETIGDEGCNLWADGPGGDSYAHELCDAVQEWGYPIVSGGVSFTVSDFVLKAFFRMHAAGPLNYLAMRGTQTLTTPFQTAAGGYQILRKVGTGEKQVFGSIAQHRAAKKQHWSSRTMVRLAA